MPIITLKSPPAGVPQRVEVINTPKIGGEGSVYFSRDERYAVKVYHRPRPEKEQLLRHVMTLFDSLPEAHERFILPPLALVESVDGTPGVGFIMRRVPPRYSELGDFTLNPGLAAQQFQSGKTWADYLKVARSIATALVVLHGKGCAHSDIHYRNFLVNLDAGDAVMLEMDGVVVAGFLPPQVQGMLGFMAPETLTDRIPPNERTDRYSLAVLLLHTLLFRNVMQPLIGYADGDPNLSDELGWGRHALFSEHPNDRRHRPTKVRLPLYDAGALSYRLLTPALQRLTERALIDGLHAPDKRPSSREWAEVLAWAVDEIWNCLRCRQHFPYPSWLQPPDRRACPFCGERMQAHYPAVLQLYEERRRTNFVKIERRLVLGRGFKLFADVLDASRNPPFTRRGEKVVGHVEWDAQRRRYQLINDEGGQWTTHAPDETQRFTAPKGGSIPLVPGYIVHFGDGRRLAVVVE